jgi:LasA protease
MNHPLRRHSRHWATQGLWLVWLMALACNLPLIAAEPGEAQKEAARQTLAVELTALADSRAAGAVTAQPPAPTSGSAQPTRPGLPPAQPTPTGLVVPAGFRSYSAQSGDTLAAVARRFGVEPEQVGGVADLDSAALLPAGQALLIPDLLEPAPYPGWLLPDSEVLFSPAALDFSIEDYIAQADGYLSGYGEMVNGAWASGAELVRRVAVESSTNPRLLLAFLEFRSGWVRGQPLPGTDLSHPLGFRVPGYRGLYYELGFAAAKLNIGYYGWRSGELTELPFFGGSRARLSPEINPGSAAIEYLFAQFFNQADWRIQLLEAGGFLELHRQMFGDPWERAAAVEPLFPSQLDQPPLELPFAPGERWSFTGGPHLSWNTGTPAGAIDFSPFTGEAPCAPSSAWVTAAAPGVVVRSQHNVVALDLDGDGHEGSGWVLVHLHIAEKDRLPEGTRVNLGDRLGHPSCERGKSTGTHVHLARKYNGEWLPAVGPLPFVLSGWQVVAGRRSYEGYLTKDGQTITASPGGASSSIISR